MKYTYLNMGNYNLYIIPTKKFKTISLSLHLRKEDTKEDSVYQAMLKKFLLAGTKSTKTLKEYNKERISIYNPSIDIIITVYGLDRGFSLTGQFLNEKYTEQGMNEKSIKFILDTLYDPKINKNKFDKETFDIVKHDYIETLKSTKDNPTAYSKQRLFEEMTLAKFPKLKIEEKIALAQTIDEEKLYNYYKSLFENNSLDIFIAGDINEEEITKIFKQNIKGNFIKKGFDRPLGPSELRTTPKEIIETSNTTQSNLAIGLKINKPTDFEYRYVSTIYIGILGGSWNSKLMQVIREKNSLCYTIYANRHIDALAAYIFAGIDAKNFEKTYKLIQEQLEEITKGNFTEEDINEIKQFYENALIEVEDNQTAIMNTLVSEKLSNTDSTKKRKEMINKVTKEDVINFSKKVHYEVVYLLKGVDENA